MKYINFPSYNYRWSEVDKCQCLCERNRMRFCLWYRRTTWDRGQYTRGNNKDLENGLNIPAKKWTKKFLSPTKNPSISQVNGQCLMDKTHEEAVRMFRSCMTELNIVVSRLVKRKAWTDSSYLCFNQCNFIARYRCNTFDEEVVVMEHKPIPVPDKYSTTIW